MIIGKIIIGMAAAGMLVFAVKPLPAAERPSAGRAPAAAPLPEAKKDCSICHLLDGPQKPRGLRKPLSRLCLDCHADRTAPADHRIDIAPARQVKGLPLTDGKITCATCHDMHTNAFGTLLRMSVRDMCLACHPQ